MQKNHVKGDMEDEDTSAGQQTATTATSEFSVVTYGNPQDQGLPGFLLRRAVCQVGWLPGHACYLLHPGFGLEPHREM